MSQRQLALRAAALVSASVGALAPIADLAARRRRRRRDNDDEDDDKLRDRGHRREREDDDDDGGRFRDNRRSRRSDDRDDEDDPEPRASRRQNRSEDKADDDDGGGRDSADNGQQAILGDLDIQAIIDERLSKALAGGGGGGDDEPNITVSEDGDSLVVLTDDIEFAGDEFGFEVETDGISYSAGDSAAGGDTDQDFTS